MVKRTLRVFAVILRNIFSFFFLHLKDKNFIVLKNLKTLSKITIK